MSIETAKEKLTQQPRSTGKFQNWNDSVTQYFNSYRGRATFIFMALLCCPLIVFMQCAVLYEFFAMRINLALLLGTCLWSSVGIFTFANRLAGYLLPSTPYYTARQLKLAKQKAEEKPDPEQAAFQEHRAQGQRVVVEGTAFQFGQSKSYLDRAPWYRN